LLKFGFDLAVNTVTSNYYSHDSSPRIQSKSYTPATFLEYFQRNNYLAIEPNQKLEITSMDKDDFNKILNLVKVNPEDRDAKTLRAFQRWMNETFFPIRKGIANMGSSDSPEFIYEIECDVNTRTIYLFSKKAFEIEIENRDLTVEIDVLARRLIHSNNFILGNRVLNLVIDKEDSKDVEENRLTISRTRRLHGHQQREPEKKIQCVVDFITCELSSLYPNYNFSISSTSLEQMLPLKARSDLYPSLDLGIVKIKGEGVIFSAIQKDPEL
jgi:hypothetical protein